MKFSVTAVLGLALGASASAVVPRGNLEARSLEVVIRVMTNVYDHMKVLDAAIAGFEGLQHVEALKKAGSEMVATVKAADAEVVVMTPVTLQEAQQFQPLSDKLNAMGDTLLGHVNAKVPTWGGLGLCPNALDMVSQIGAGVVKLMGDVADKFPTDGQGESNQGIIQHFTKLFDDAIAKLTTCAAGKTIGGPKDTWVQEIVVVATTTEDCDDSTSAPAGAVPTLAIKPATTIPGVAATPTPYYPKPGNATSSWAPAATSTRPYVVTAGAALNGVAAGAVALMAAAYFL